MTDSDAKAKIATLEELYESWFDRNLRHIGASSKGALSRMAFEAGWAAAYVSLIESGVSGRDLGVVVDVVRILGPGRIAELAAKRD